MRLRSARLAGIEPINLPGELPTVTKRPSKKRGRKKEAESAQEVEAVAAEGPLEQRAEDEQPQHDDPATAPSEVASDVPDDLQLHPSESPLFNAEAAAEATRLAEALLSSPPAGEQLSMAQPPPAEMTQHERPHTQADMCAVRSASTEQDESGVGARVSEAASKHAAAAVQHSEHAAMCSSWAGTGISFPGQNMISGGKFVAAESCPSLNRTLATSRDADSVSAHTDTYMRAPSSLKPSAADHCAQRAGVTAEASTSAGTASEGPQQAGTQHSPEQAQLHAAHSSDTWQPTQTAGAAERSAAQHRPRRGASLALKSHRASKKSGAAEAFERGRRSGIWMGSTDAQLGSIQQQWNTYKATTQRGWTMPELADVRTKSKALERSGFTMAQSPKLRQSSRSAFAQVHPSNQLKRKAEEAMHADNAKKVAKTGALQGASPQSKAAAVPAANGSPAAVGGSMRRKAAVGPPAWAASPSRFGRNAQENRACMRTPFKGARSWVS